MNKESAAALSNRRLSLLAIPCLHNEVNSMSRRRLLLFGLLFCLLPSLSLAQTVQTHSGYTAAIDANGVLTSVKMGGVELISRPLEFCPGVKWTVDRTETPSPNDLRVLLKSDRGTGELDYRFEERQIVLTMRHRLGGFQGWQIGLTENVVGVENLQDTNVDSAETIRYVERGDIRASPIISLARTQRVRLHLNSGAKVLFWHDGWGAPFNVDEAGKFDGYTYRRSLLENDKPMRLTFALDTPAAKPLQPAPAFVPYGAAFANLSLTGSPIRFQIKFSDATVSRLKAAPHWRVQWTVRDFFNRPAGQGQSDFASAAALTAKSAEIVLPPKTQGWYSVLFALSPVGSVSPAIAPSEYRTRFAVVDRSPAVPDVPAARDERVSVYGYAALMGLKGMRESHRMSDFFPERDKPKWKQLDEVMDNAAKESKRWGVSWFFQANEVPKWCSPADYEQIVFEMVSHCKDRCKVWEVENEPNFRMSPADYVQKSFMPFIRGAKRADPNCSVIGPACVSVPNSIRFVEELRKQDALPFASGISTHTYMGPGEPWELFGNPQYLAKLQSLGGSLPLWQTEQGYTWNHTSRDEQARYVVRQYLNGSAAGIPNERQYYFYTVHNGFEPWYLAEASGNSDGDNGTLEPAGVAMRTLTIQTDGRMVGSLEQPLFGVYALRFSGPKDDVIALWTLDFHLTLTLKNTILQATRIDGAPLALRSQKSGTLVPTDGYALYLRVPKGEKLALQAPRSFGKNYASAALGATIHAASETKDHPATHAIDGRWAMRDATPGLDERTWWEANTVGASAEAPQWLRVDFPQPRTIDRSLMLCPVPAVDGGVPRDYAVQVSDDGIHWRTVAEIKDWVGWSGSLPFAPVRTQHVRLLITRLNDGWHLDGKWRFMVSDEFKQYTSMKCRVLDWMLFGP